VFFLIKLVPLQRGLTSLRLSMGADPFRGLTEARAMGIEVWWALITGNMEAMARRYKSNCIHPALESTWFQPLNMTGDLLVSNFAYKFNSCHYIMADIENVMRKGLTNKNTRDIVSPAVGRVACRVGGCPLVSPVS
jgi:hypothetical protein